MSDYFVCPHCYAEVPLGAPACPECGSDEETGWSQETAYDGLFLYDDVEQSSDAEQSSVAGEAPVASRPWFKYLLGAATAFTLFVFVAFSVPRVVAYYLLPLLLVVGVVYFLARSLTADTRSRREKQLYAQLLQRARGDAELLERLVGYERRRKPGADRLELLENVLYHWERDSR